MPRARNSASISLAPGLGSSAKAISARRSSLPPTRSAMADTVAPWACKRAASDPRFPMSTPNSRIQRRLPMTRLRPATWPSTPLPGTARTSVAASRRTPFCADSASTALASGCSLPLCRLAAAASIACSSMPPVAAAAASVAVNRAVNLGLPSVNVPVLSKAITLTLCASSSACTSLIKMPCFAATPVPAMMAVGVASPNAQGQAITSTATA